jgi:Cof subfamily protein (haloacid dehalogenase superfamily)
MSDVRLLIADVDGTLVDQRKQLTQRSIDVVKKLSDAGILFTVTSGRPPRGMLMLVQPLGIKIPIAGFNGGAFVNPDMSPLERHEIDRAASKPVFDTVLAHNLDAWVYCDQGWYLRDPKAPHVDREQQTVQFPPTVVTSLIPELDRAVKIVGVSDDLAAVERAETDIRRDFGKVVSAGRSQPYYLDVTHPDANKGFVVRRLSEMLKIPIEQIATIGDMPTDVLMFNVSGVSIAMGNASPQVKAQAKFVTAGNDAEGFALAVEKFIL